MQKNKGPVEHLYCIKTCNFVSCNFKLRVDLWHYSCTFLLVAVIRAQNKLSACHLLRSTCFPVFVVCRPLSLLFLLCVNGRVFGRDTRKWNPKSRILAWVSFHFYRNECLSQELYNFILTHIIYLALFLVFFFMFCWVMGCWLYPSPPTWKTMSFVIDMFFL